MKIKHLIIFFLINNLNASGQYWENETKWVYDQIDFTRLRDDYNIFDKIGDTIINDLNCVKIQSKYFSGEELFIGRNFTLCSENNEVKYFSTLDSTLKQLYNFNLGKNDTMEVYCPFDEGLFEENFFKVIIDSIGVIEINGENRKVQYVHTDFDSNTDWCYMDGKIIEGIGWTQYLLPSIATVDPVFGGDLICFFDGDFSYHVSNPQIDNECDIIVNAESIERNEIKILPNPNCEYIEVGGIIPDKLEVYSIGGKLLKVIINSSKLEISDLPNELYFLKIFNNESIYVEKIMKFCP